MRMRTFPSLILALAVSSSALARQEAVQVTLDYVAKKAEERARKPFRSPRADLPAVLRQENLDYDKYREIEFRHERALWLAEDLPFRAEFFHPGYQLKPPCHSVQAQPYQESLFPPRYPGALELHHGAFDEPV